MEVNVAKKLTFILIMQFARMFIPASVTTLLHVELLDDWNVSQLKIRKIIPRIPFFLESEIIKVAFLKNFFCLNRDVEGKT